LESGNVFSLSGRDPVTNNAGTDHVGDEIVFVPSREKQNGAETTPAVNDQQRLASCGPSRRIFIFAAPPVGHKQDETNPSLFFRAT